VKPCVCGRPRRSLDLLCDRCWKTVPWVKREKLRLATGEERTATAREILRQVRAQLPKPAPQPQQAQLL
jgi:hypothetical protein